MKRNTFLFGEGWFEDFFRHVVEKFEFAPEFPPRYAHTSTAEPLATYRGHLLFFLCERSVSGSGEVVSRCEIRTRLR